MKGFKTILKNLTIGEIVYINAINLTSRQIDILRKEINTGNLQVYNLESYVCRNFEHYQSGLYILPQAEYIKVK